MSIYSGLPTREDEGNYNKLLCKLITTMQQHIIQLSEGIIATHFGNRYRKIIARLQNYEEHKYLPPKFSTLLKPLEETMRDSLIQKAKMQNKNQKKQKSTNLYAVKEEEQLPSSRKIQQVSPTNHTDLYMRKTFIKNKKVHKKSYALSDNQQLNTRNTRSHSVFSEKKSKAQTQPKKIQRINMMEVGKKKYHPAHSSTGTRYRSNSKNVLTQSHEDNKIYYEGNKNLMKALSEATKKMT